MSEISEGQELFDVYDPRYSFDMPAPDAGIFDTPFICLPINMDWVGHVDGVIDRLCYTDAWGGTEEEKERAVQEARKLLIALRGGMCMYQLRANPDDPCILEQSHDGGETWTTAFDFSDCLTETRVMMQGVYNNQNNVNIQIQIDAYNADPANYAPEVKAVDDATNATYCYALNVWVRMVLNGYLESVREDNKRQAIENGVYAIGATFVAMVTSTPWGAFMTGISTAVWLVEQGIKDAIEEGSLAALIEDDEKIAQFVCCAYGKIKDTRITEESFAAMWDEACPGMSQDVVDLLPALDAVAEDFDVYLTFLTLCNDATDMYEQGTLSNDCGDCDAWQELWLSGNGNPADDGWLIDIGAYNGSTDYIDGKNFGSSSNGVQLYWDFTGEFNISTVTAVMSGTTAGSMSRNVEIIFRDDQDDIVDRKTATWVDGNLTITYDTGITVYNGWRLQFYGSVSGRETNSTYELKQLAVSGVGANPWQA